LSLKKVLDPIQNITKTKKEKEKRSRGMAQVVEDSVREKSWDGKEKSVSYTQAVFTSFPTLLQSFKRIFLF
jgi:hypothetical protein